MSAQPKFAAAKCTIEGHAYQARYDEQPAGFEVSSTFAFWNRGKDLPMRKIWVGDVCSRCGDLITRRR